MTVEIRALTQDDWQAFSVLRLEALKDSPEVYYSNLAAEQNYTEADWRGWFARDSDRIFGLYDGATMVGQIGVFGYKNDTTGQSGVIGAVYLTPAYRGRGLSHRLYQACIDWAIGYQTWRRLVVSHRVGNEASRGAIVGQGFKHTHRAAQTWINGEVVDEDFYEIDLESLRGRKNGAN